MSISKTQKKKHLKRSHLSPNIVTLFIGVVDLTLIGIAVICGYYIRFHLELGVASGLIRAVPKAPLSQYLKAIVFVAYVLLFLFLLFKLYKRERSRWMIDEIHAIIKSLTFGYLILINLTFFIRASDIQYSRTVLVYSYILSIIFLIAWRYLVLTIERWLHLKGLDASRVLIVGSSEMARIVVRKIQEKPFLGYRIVGFTSVLTENLVDLESFPYLGSLDQVPSLLDEYPIDEVMITETDLSHFKLLEMVSTCEEYNIDVKMVPTVYDLLIDFADMNDLDGLPLVAVREQPMYKISLFMKRVFDIVFSSVILAIAWPLCLIIAVLIRLDSRGPIVFIQRRAGVGGVPFKMYKFRTMYEDAESKLDDLVKINDLDEPVFKIKNDPRITRIGRILRRSSLDEILQFWNVLRGDMSIVGPRPEETQLVDKYNIWQRRRLKIKPGITGMQQVMCRGTTSLSDRIKYDIFYLRKHSLLVDIYIILKTIPVVITGKGAS